MHKGEAVHTQLRPADGECPVIFEHVPAWICGQCGETGFPDAAMAEMDRLLGERPRPVRTVSADVYDLSTVKAWK